MISGVSLPILICAFVSAHHRDHYTQLAGELEQRLPGAQLFGCSAGGVIGAGRELEAQPALSLAAARLPEVVVTPVVLSGDPRDWPDACSWPDDTEALIVLADPFTARAELLLQWLDVVHPDVIKVGGLASGASSPGDGALFLGSAIHRSGAIALALSGEIRVDTVVAQGCRPIGSPMFATRVEGNLLHELDGQPASRALETLYRQLPADDQRLFRGSLFLGMVMEPQRQQYGRGDFLVRNVVGLEADSGALVVGARLDANAVVQFHVRDADTSAEDLDEQLRAHRGPLPSGALLFSCLGRGRELYGRPDHDSELFTRHVGPVPMGGFFCNGEIGPVGGRTFLHGYTSSFALFSRR